MSKKYHRNARRIDLLGGLAAAALLFILVNYAARYLHQPDLGFRVHPETWRVVYIDPLCIKAAHCLKLDDQVLQIGDTTFEAAQSSRLQPIYETHWDLDNVATPVIAIRDHQRLTIQAYPVQDSRATVRKILTVLFPILFWLTGTLAVLFLRPRDERWFAFIGFNYVTALWVSSGFLSSTQIAYSSVVFHAVIWFFLPLSVHLHLVLPDNLLPRAKNWILVPIYLLAFGLSVLDAMHLLDGRVYLVSTLLSVAASLLLLVLRNLRRMPRDIRVANRVMLYGTFMWLGPLALMILFFMTDPTRLLASSNIATAVGLFLGISPMWLMTYLYAVYRHDLATFEFRANRLLGVYGFLALNITLVLIFFNSLSGPWERSGGDLGFFSLLTSCIFVLVAPPLYARFQRLVDLYVFGIKYRPSEIVSAFAQKIPTALDREILRQVLQQEVLPTLQIRQSALFIFGHSEVEALYKQNTQVHFTDETELRDLLLSSGHFISFGRDSSAPTAWVRLIIPLSVRDRTLGVWLLGRRDPDDYYPKSDITLLQDLANQIAPVIENFRLVEKARSEVRENRRLQQQLLQSQKMEAIGRLSAGVAHDFNNILSVIIGYSNLLLVQYPKDPRLQQSASNIRDAGNRAATLTKQLLAFSRQQVLEPQVTDLNEIVADVEKMLRRLTSEDVALATELGESLARVRVDSGQMAQVIINLVVNARDAIVDGGSIHIETGSLAVEDPDDCPFKGLPTGAYVTLSVTDDGSGIEPEILGRIFEPYFTTKEVGKGTGLGLSMVYGIINQSKGHVFVDSELEKGSVFTICLPAVPESEASPSTEDHIEKSSRPGSEKILLAEDEDSVRDVTTRILESCGYQVTTAVDGRDALDKFEIAEVSFDLLLTDVVMPRMKGTDLARQLLRLDPELRIVFMSGYNEEAVLGRDFDKGGPLLIQKPFSPQTLTRSIRRVLDQPAVEVASSLSPGAD